MENSTTKGEDANSRSASEKNTSDTNLKTRDSGDDHSNSSKSTRGQAENENATPTPKPQHGGQQSSTTPKMAPPPRPNFRGTPSSAQPSKPASSVDSEPPASSVETTQNGSRQPAASSKPPAKDAVHATPRKRGHVEIDRQQKVDDEDSTDEENEPANAIAAFDWMDLESRYHQQMDQYRVQEQDLYRSFDELCGVSNALPDVLLSG